MKRFERNKSRLEKEESERLERKEYNDLARSLCPKGFEIMSDDSSFRLIIRKCDEIPYEYYVIDEDTAYYVTSSKQLLSIIKLGCKEIQRKINEI